MDVMSHLVSVWFLCIPSLISVTKSSQVVLNQSIIVYWGGLNQGIFIDEACYWALIIGDCGQQILIILSIEWYQIKKQNQIQLHLYNIQDQ